MFRATFQKSFITLQDLEEEACKGTALRSRAISLESVLDHRDADNAPCAHGVKAQLERLDQLMKDNVESSSIRKDACDKCMSSTVPKMTGSKHLRVASGSSVSTMAPEDLSECDGDSNPNRAGFCKIRRGASNTSICSLISEDSDETLQTDAHKSSPTKTSTEVQTVRSLADDFSHCNVPRHVNLAEEFAAKSTHSGPPTTIMIRNIPNRLSQPQIVKELEHLGFAGTFDFFYAPMDKRTKCTVGYAFVNFLHSEYAARCMHVMERHYFQSYGRQGQKQARVSVAHLQGFDANIQHYKNAAVTSNPTDNRNGPIIMPRIATALHTSI